MIQTKLAGNWHLTLESVKLLHCPISKLIQIIIKMPILGSYPVIMFLRISGNSHLQHILWNMVDKVGERRKTVEKRNILAVQ